jgi:RNA polymerase primary sigma factor
MIAFTPKPKRRRLRRRQILSLSEVDVLLDVRVSEFDRTVARRVREFRALDVSVRIPKGEELIALKPMDSRVSWARLYEAQVQRLARMGRAEEFLMARRYEFFKARAAAALRELSYPEDTIPVLLKRGRRQLPPPSARPKPKPVQVANLERALREFEALRNHYVEGALYMVLGCAHRYRNLGVDFVDLIQEGNASLFQAVEGFDWRRDVRFKTYAQYWIHQAVLKVLYNSSRTVRVPIWVQKALAKIQRIREQGRKQDGAPPSAKEVGAKLGLSEDRVRELLRTKRYAVSLDAEVTGEDGASLGQLLPDRRAEPIVEAIEDGNLGICLDEVMADLPSREHMILTRRFGLHGKAPETLGQIAADLGITAERVRQLQKAALGRLQKPTKISRLRSYK